MTSFKGLDNDIIGGFRGGLQPPPLHRKISQKKSLFAIFRTATPFFQTKWWSSEAATTLSKISRSVYVY